MVSCKVRRECYIISTSQMVELKVLRNEMAYFTMSRGRLKRNSSGSLSRIPSVIPLHMAFISTMPFGSESNMAFRQEQICLSYKFTDENIEPWRDFFSPRQHNGKSFASKSKFIFVIICWLFNLSKSYVGYLKIIQSLGFEKK